MDFLEIFTLAHICYALHGKLCFYIISISTAKVIKVRSYFEFCMQLKKVLKIKLKYLVSNRSIYVTRDTIIHSIIINPLEINMKSFVVRKFIFNNFYNFQKKEVHGV